MTGALLQPVHVGRIGGKPVGFYRGASATPDLPWTDLDALGAALGLPRLIRRTLLSGARRHFPNGVRTIATSSGVVAVAAHIVAQSFLEAAVQAGAPKAIEADYLREASTALRTMAGGRPPSARVEHALAAFHNAAAAERDAIGDDGSAA